MGSKESRAKGHAPRKLRFWTFCTANGEKYGHNLISWSIDIIVNKPIDQKVVELSSSQRYSLVENSMYHAVFLLKAYKMTFSYNQVKELPKLFLAMTGLTHAEF